MEQSACPPHRSLVRCSREFMDNAYANYVKLAGLPKHSQDMFLHDNISRSCVVACQRQYRILGQRVCRQALRRFLVLGKFRWNRVTCGHADMRKRTRAKFEMEGPKAADVFSYLWGLYTNVAEYTPFSQIDVVAGTQNALT